jgi:hypothetical protein
MIPTAIVWILKVGAFFFDLDDSDSDSDGDSLDAESWGFFYELLSFHHTSAEVGTPCTSMSCSPFTVRLQKLV